MAIPYNGKYSDKSKYLNPGDDVDPKIKRGTLNDPESKDKQYNWFLQKCEWIYSAYLNDDAYIPYSSIKDYRINRLYSQGMQPNNKYMDRLTITDKRTNLRKGWMNISWDILPILPKFRSLVIGKFEDIDYNIQVRAIDNASTTAREDVKLTIMVEQKHAELLKDLKEALGIKEPKINEEASMPFIPKSIDEFNMMASMGAFRLAWEISMDKLLNDTAAKNNWQDLKRRLIEDAIDLGVIAVKDYQDPQTHQPMCRYVDPEYFVIRQTRRNDFNDVSEAGEICWFTLEQLKGMGLSEDQLRTCANAYNAMWGNGIIQPNRLSGDFDRNRYDNFRIGVLDCEFTSMDREFYESRQMNGREVLFDMPYNSTKPTNKKNKLNKTEKPKFYRAKWVIGTNIIFDYGLQYDVPYNQNVFPKSSFSCYRISERSMISQCISSADDIQLTVLKFRNAVASSKPPGLMIEWGSISQLSLGGEKLDPWDVLKIYGDRGDLLFKYALNPSNGMPIQGGIAPITPLQGGIGPYLNELIETMTWHMNLIREITGLNAVVDASTPQPKALVGTAKIAEAGTNHVLRPILSGYKSVKQRLFANLCNRWQMTAKFYPQEVVIGQANAAFETIKLAPKLYDPIFDVFCEALISDDDKMTIMQAAMESIRAAKTGSVGITMMDFFYIQQLLAIGNIRWAWVYLSYREKIIQDEAHARAMQMQQVQAQMAQQQQAQKIQADMALLQAQEEQKRLTMKMQYELETQSKIAIEAAKSRYQMLNKKDQKPESNK